MSTCRKWKQLNSNLTFPTFSGKGVPGWDFLTNSHLKLIIKGGNRNGIGFFAFRSSKKESVAKVSFVGLSKLVKRRGDLNAYSCKQCRITIFPARGHEARFFLEGH